MNWVIFVSSDRLMHVARILQKLDLRDRVQAVIYAYERAHWYHFGMSKQIAVRLDDELVAFVDEIVGSGKERSRAAVVTRALERERRRMTAVRDAEILAATGPDPELEGLAEHAARLRVDH